ncbi:MAG: AEC family transporter [Peptoniphilus sp.]|uniref:AEC family transporter n=1 Tax=Peptoniphilus sp. TaxID=1971214 RepID=UPI0025EE7539|nr:AEC family transporter [Peptoniphilus sp.]MCI5642874.1 AEC family transporter [Peptoniphilus sp.]
METLILFKNLIVFLIIIMIAFFVRKSHKVSNKLQKDMSYLLINVTTPCIIVTSMAVEFTEDKFIQARDTFLIANVIFIFSYFLIYFIMKFYKVEEPNKSQMMVGGIFTNLGFLGFPLILAMFGKDGLYIASIVNMVSNYFTYTIGIGLIKKNSTREGKLRFRDFFNNANIATIIGLIILFSGFKIPDFIYSVLEIVGNGTGLFSMIIIGLMLGEMDIKDIFVEKRAYAMSFYRLILLPVILIALFCVVPIKIDPFVEKIIIILFSMPVASITGIFSVQYDVDPAFGTKLVMQSTVLCVITLPIILYLYNFL